LPQTNYVMKYPVSVLLILLLFKTGMAATYYFSPAGNDQTNSGTSIASPWSSIDKLNTIDLNPGDVVLFQGGATFTGSIYLEITDMGTALQPIIVTSYGAGRAIINGGTLPGLYAENTGGIEVRGINFIAGSGNVNPGVFFYTARTDINMEYIRIEDVEVSGYFDYGVSIGASSVTGTKGFSNVLINRVLSHDNQSGGIISYGGGGTTFNHNNIKVANTIAYNNKGVLGATNNTGNGILLSSTENSLIDSCEAYNNGENNNFAGGGPVGIWFAQARNSIIQNSTSHNNRTQTRDGGGFDLDNACQNCTIQYCFSYNNDGAGYLMANYGIDIPFTGNVIRYNISENDGQKADRAGIILWAPVGGAGEVKDCQIYNNTVYIYQTGVFLDDVNFSNVKFNNNIFYGPPGSTLVKGAVDISRVQFLQNDYFSANATPLFNWNNINYSSLAAWRNATGQERSGSTDYGLAVNPLLTNPGGGREGYRLNANSPMIDAGLNLTNIGNRDFYGGMNKVGSTQDIGAYESQSTLAFSIVSFMARKQGNQILIDWDVNDEVQIRSYVLESSIDAIHFTALYEINSARRAKSAYRFTENEKEGTIYYRLKSFYQDGTFKISQVISVRNMKSALTLLNNIVDGSIIIRLDNEEPVNITLLNGSGALLETRHFARQAGLINWPVSNYTKGVYYLKVLTHANESKPVIIIKK